MSPRLREFSQQIEAERQEHNSPNLGPTFKPTPVQYLAASHPQDMDGWPAYWERMIPMHYATHVVRGVVHI